ncbi:MAG: hypothetical protein ACI4DO_09280 [Roseburia sp.]
MTKTGTFKIKVNTAANGIYGAGEETITFTVDNGAMAHDVVIGGYRLSASGAWVHGCMGAVIKM